MKKTKMTSPQSRRKQLWLKAISMMLSLAILFCFTPVVIYAEIAESLKAEDAEAATAVEEEALSTDDLLVYEDTSLRETNVKHFRLADGTYVAAQYAYPVHYTNADGELEDIDNTLSESSGGIYANSTARIKFAKKTNGSSTLFTLKDGNTKLEMSLINARKGIYGLVENSEDNESDTELQKMMHLENLSSKITYHNILDGVDLEYVIHSLNVKENIIVRKQSDSYSYEFELKLNGLTAALTESQDIEIRENGALKYVIPAPVVFDAVGQHADSDDAYYTLTGGSNGKYLLTVTVDPEWMNADERAFPVTVDPSVGQLIAGGYMYDTYIDAGNPNSSLYTVDPMIVSKNHTMYWRAVTLPTLPQNARISSATISFYTAYATATMAIGAHLVTSAWGSPMTYNNYLAGASAYEPGYQDIVNVYASMYATWDITDAVIRWYTEDDDNYGIAFAPISEVSYSASSLAGFYPMEHEHSDPIFSVNYRNTVGIESYWSYSTQGVGRAGSGGVNLATGGLAFSIPTLTTTDNIMPYTPTLVYNSGMANLDYTASNANVSYTDARAPIGMMLSTSETVKKVQVVQPDGLMVSVHVYVDSDGTEHYFSYNNNDSDPFYCDEDGLGLKLKLNTNGSLSITDRNKTVRNFTAIPYSERWYLTSIRDISGNSVRFTTDSLYRTTAISFQPTRREFDSIEMLRLYYDGSSGRLTRIYNPTSREAAVLRYSSTYNGAIVSGSGKYLRRIDYAHGTASVTDSNWSAFEASSSNTTNIVIDASMYYQYDSVGRLSYAEDNMSAVAIDYVWSGNRVSSATEASFEAGTAGQSLKYTYGTNYTDVRSSGNDDAINTSDDVITRYVFDSMCRAISVYSFSSSQSEIYGAAYGEYDTADSSRNSLKQQTVLGGTSVNHLLNGGFDMNPNSSAINYWTASGAVTKIKNSLVSENGGYVVSMQPTVGTTATIKQIMSLEAGTYTLSFPFKTQNGAGAYARARIFTSSGSTLHTSPLNLNPNGTNGVYSFFQTTFDVNDDGIYWIEIAITNYSYATSTALLEVDDIMLESGSGSSHYSLISYGNFTPAGEAHLEQLWGAEGNILEASTSSANQLFGDCLRIPGAYSTKIVSQRVFEASTSDLANMVTNNSGAEYTLSGYARGINSILSGNSPFRLALRIAYYQGAGESDLIRYHYVDFLPEVEDWQFASGTFSTMPDLDETSQYYTIRYIDVLCEYSLQPGGTAYFDNVSLVKNTGNTDKYEYTSDGYIKSQSDYYNSTYYYYDEENNLTRTADTRGSVIDCTYGAYDRLSSVVTSAIAVQSYYSYSDFENDSVPLEYRGKTRYLYNAFGQISSVITSDLNASGTEISATPDHTVNYTYNITNGSKIFGALISEMEQGGSTVAYYYNGQNGDLMATVNITDGYGMAYTYDALGRITSVLPAAATTTASYTTLAGAQSVNYSYDQSGSLASIATDSTTYSFVYDDFGNVSEAKIGGSSVVSYEYNESNGKLKSITYANGYTFGYEYNELELLSKVWYTEGDSTLQTTICEYDYTADGKLYRYADKVECTVLLYKYDNRGRVIAAAESYDDDLINTHSYSVSYNDRDFIHTLKSVVGYTYKNADTGVYADSTQSMNYTYTYNAMGELSRQVYSSGNISANANYGYDRYSRPAIYAYSYSIGNTSLSRTVNFAYDTGVDYTSYRVSGYTSTVGNSTTAYTYTYDAAGRITSVTNSNNNLTTNYYYDNVGQLIREDNAELGLTIVYIYDDAGNIIHREYANYTVGSINNYSYGYSYSYHNTAWKDQLTSYDDYVITYDSIGNPLVYHNGEDYSFVWNCRELKSATVYGVSYSFTYNDLGLRTTKRSSNRQTTYYYYEGNRLVGECVSGYDILYIYDKDGSPIGMQYREKDYAVGVWDIFWYDKNLLGDIVAVYSSAGVKLVSYAYSAYGDTYTTYHNGGGSTGAAKNPFRYRGYYYDSDLCFYYLESRYYDPVTCRFISPDDLSYLGANGDLNSYNLYAYCSNDPINYVDPSGHEIIFATLATCGIVTLAVCGLIWLAQDAVGEQKLAKAASGIADAVSDGIQQAKESVISLFDSKVDTDSKDSAIPYNANKQAYFTVNPYDFNPSGLIMTEYPGTRNGKVVKWTDPTTGNAIFEWNEDLDHGPHYHILFNGKHTGDHILPNSPVPEPWNTIYFGGANAN